MSKIGTYHTKCDYLGGHPAHPKGGKSARLEVSEKRIQVIQGFSRWEIPWSDVTNISVEGNEEVERRVTATRLIALGVFAFAAKKKSKNRTSYLTFATTSGDAMFEIDGEEPHQLEAKMSPFRPLVNTVPSYAQPQQAGPTMSPDGSHYWNGSSWVPVPTAAPLASPPGGPPAER